MKTKPLVIGLGNELLGDDAIGIIAARKLLADNAICADVVDCNFSGVGLLDILCGYRRVIFIDAIKTGKLAPGTVMELDIGSLRSIPSHTPHHTGLCELINLAKWLEFDFPEEIVIIAVEVKGSCILGANLSESVNNALCFLLDKVKSQLNLWNEADNSARNILRTPGIGIVDVRR
jgi:hydrogenase maturation protease